MPEYLVRLLPLVVAAVSLTPASAITYTRPVAQTVASDASAPASASATPTFGATYDALTGKFTATPSVDDTDDDSPCGAADCPVATTAAVVARPATAPHAVIPPSSSAISASANWYVATLVANTYGYNGDNEAFRISPDTYLPQLPDPTSWAMMFGGMIAIGFLLRKPQPPVSEAEGAAMTWDGTTVRMLEIRTPIVIKQARAASVASHLCCSRQALPGS